VIHTITAMNAQYSMPKVAADIRALLAEGDVMVRVEQAQDTRSAKQNRLMWLWHGVVGKETGEASGEVHDRIKEVIVLPIMLSYPDRYEHAAQIEQLLAVRPTAKALLVRLISTTDLTVKHMAEFLTAYERYASSMMGMVFPRPEDIYYAALGERR